MHLPTTAELTLQQWGNSLAMRIPAGVARQAHFMRGQAVRLSVCDAGVVVTPIKERPLSLAQRLALFDPSQHSGEAMVTHSVGKEEL